MGRFLLSAGAIVAAITIASSFAHAQQVFRCTLPDGSTTFQGTQCETPDADMERIRVSPGPSAEQTAAAQARHQESQARHQFESEHQAYQTERRRLEREINSINLGLDQTVSDLMTNRNRHRRLSGELEALDQAWQDRLDPGGATQRAEERRQRETSERLSAIEREQRRARREQILKDNQPTTLRNCRTMGNTVICD
ncbi:chromosome segregation ATPase [Natronocella acetinitrilica]|uniref:Chromosome segregation ATPase n=1 Tax=Natronocella acetinitrilica TaxID=414046 RepID=A0AAE3KBK8_9GAMM|nr:hypothetical protein [Natronocella acetinitrilica]MCP1675695.1 chromosome segregation ATPase [Natronocella acetinitrilica]